MKRIEANFVTSVIQKYKHHPSIKAIKRHMEKIKSRFSFSEITKTIILK